jgi:hypothetical protein
MPSHSYNSVIYASVGANNYIVFWVNPTFVDPRHANLSSSELLGLMTFWINDTQDAAEYAAQVADEAPILGHLLNSAVAGTLDKLDIEQCIRSYGTMFLSNRSNLLMVRDDEPYFGSLFINNEVIDTIKDDGCAVDPVPWICLPKDDCKVSCLDRLNEVLVEVQNLTGVKYCLSQPTEEFCKLQFSLPIAIVIILFNFFKALIMLILAFGLREARVQTMGDAITSFLVQPDHIVFGRCLYNASDFKLAGLSGNPRNLTFTKKSTRFAETGERRVWILTYIL